MKHLNDIDVLVLGLGVSGLAMARWCARHGARVRVWDSRDVAPGDAALAETLPAAQRLRGELSDEAFAGVKLILKSPGLAPADARIAAPLARAADSGILVQGELELFARALADLKEERGYAPRLLAITGTNGKTTTTAMTALLVERAGRRAAVAGNIMPTMLDRLMAMLDGPRDAWVQVWVLELSSFQLADAQAFEPTAAAVLNLTQDHLDWHGSMAAYAGAKARLFAMQSAGHVAVIAQDDEPSRTIAAHVPGRLVAVSADAIDPAVQARWPAR